ncbi:two-component system LytT family response regulator [Luteibacter jiangsuensis]|uniref:Two-component system LytT family response regulator n=1 Tax=Luteibacter jiangsuensis TaxID=637577 RepID=A0ABT9SWE9_9GAMM|nr:LytTR family DNA-binding domain-containing protein [Luteibacter jiangsuensis]MDQ0009100.1 two-component system LytT family response regulator [Luteibacter jiangsuensis]
MTASRATRDRMIRTLLVDDEPLARRGLELRLAGERDIVIVGQVGDGAAAVHAVSEHAPDLLFLDVQMPGLDGFATLRAIPAQRMPLVVFVTAYDHYALQAFEASAVDYLLKPVDDSRLHQALFRVRETLDRREASDHRAKLLGLIGTLSGRPALTLDEALDTAGAREPRDPEAPLAIRDGARTLRLPRAGIRWVDAAGDYLCIHTDRDTHVLRTPLGQLEERLGPNRFPRIHRSTLVNAARVVALRPHLNGEYFLTLDCGQELKLSRSYRDRLALFK